MTNTKKVYEVTYHAEKIGRNTKVTLFVNDGEKETKETLTTNHDYSRFSTLIDNRIRTWLALHGEDAEIKVNHNASVIK